MGFKRGDTVQVRGYSGVAWWVLGPEQIWEPAVYFAEVQNDDGELIEVEIPDVTEGEWVPVDGRYDVCMVGDDRVFHFDAEDLTPLDEEDFCGGCGQVGCKAYS